MTRDDLINYCNEIMSRTQFKKLQRLFYEYPPNQDIIIEKITRNDIISFSQKLLIKFEKYIEK